MRTLALVGTVALLCVGTAMGQSTVTFTLQVGGDNHADDLHNGTFVAYTPGVESNTYVLQGSVSTTLNWAVRVAVAGTHTGDSTITQGLANFVFDVTLKDPSLNPVTGDRFFSDANDGSSVENPLEMAAWCEGWDVDGDLDGTFDGLGPSTGNGPGRLFDPAVIGGPFMDRAQFPSTSTFGGGHMSNGEAGYVAKGAMSTSAPDGTLLGMGIGYSQFALWAPGWGLSGANSLGVGIDPAFSVTNPLYGFPMGLGAIPAAEGQIDMTGLPGGTYTLELTAPANAQNIILGTYDAVYGGTGGFAAVADAVVPDTIEFVWDPGIPPCGPYAITSWESVKQHGGSPLSIVLPASGTPLSESRSGGLTQLQVTFDTTVDPNCYTEANIALSGPGLSVAGSTLAGNVLTIDLAGSVDQSCYTIDLSAAIDGLTGDADCTVAVLLGDTNNDKSANLTDMAQVKSKNGQTAAAAGARFDLNLDGSVNLTDMAQAKSRNGNSVTCP